MIIKEDITKSLLIHEVEQLFENGNGDKVTAMTFLLQCFMEHEGIKNNFADKNFVSNLLAEATEIINFLATGKEALEAYKKERDNRQPNI